MSGVIALTRRWDALRPHPVQMAYKHSTARFNVVPAGRRSGKTERFKRKIITAALRHNKPWNGNYGACAPTRDQAKAIYWGDLKAMIPPDLIAGAPRESDLVIQLVNGCQIAVIGMDRPMRIEGRPWDGLGLDEYGNMKPEAWTANVRPALSDRLGWCDFLGVPEGRNHYYQLYQRALQNTTGEWAAFTWPSSDILPPEEIESARRDLDELTFRQEYEASFVSFAGMAYYNFNEKDHYRACRQLYDKKQPLIFCFDFNVAPGVAAILQERSIDGIDKTCVIGEVYIPQNSNTPAVCRRLIKDWGKHEGLVYCYGDATGGASGSAKVLGSDWDLIKQELRPAFGQRILFRVPKANPRERVRVNAVNSRIKSTTGAVRFAVDPVHAPHVILDFEGVRTLEGGSGEIDKQIDPALTHVSDAIGYYIEAKFPVTPAVFKVEELVL